MLSTPRRQGPLSLAKVPAAPITDVPKPEGWEADGSAGDPRLSALRLQLAAYGLSVHRMQGTELAVSGSGFARMVPDTRCAWLLVRQLKGGA